jgi:replicative DNA helicase
MTLNFSPEIEESLLSLIIKYPDLMNYISDQVSEEDFYWKPYSTLFSVYFSLYTEGKGIDKITVLDELERRGEILNIYNTEISETEHGIEYIINKEAELENYETYIKIIKDNSTKRKIYYLSNRIKERINNSTTKEIIEYIDKELNDISILSETRNNSITPVTDILEETIQEIEKAKKGNREYLETGLTELDKLIGGFFNEQLVIVAGRQGEGKSALLLTFAMNIATNPLWSKKVGIFSLEMGKKEYTQRIISFFSGIPTLRIRLGKIFDREKEQYKKAIETIRGLGIFFDDSPSLTIPTLRGKIRKMVEMGAKIIFIDQLEQLISSKENENEYIRVDKLTYQLKGLAREFGIPIVVAHQLNRSIEHNEREPKPSDLSQAGEKATDLILIIRHKKEDAVIKSSRIYCVKNRSGALGYVNVKFIGESVKFIDDENPLDDED